MQRVFDEAQEHIDDQQSEYRHMADLIKEDYDQFLDEYVKQPELVADD